jgi:hypothetical protein
MAEGAGWVTICAAGRLPTMFHSDRPVVGCPHEGFEGGTITLDPGKRSLSCGVDCDEHNEQRPFTPSVAPEQIRVGKTVHD